MPPIKRSASEELDDGGNGLRGSRKTSRPTRQSAGKRSLAAGFVRTDDVVIGNDDGDSTSDSEPDESGRHSRLSHKKRAPSPPPAELPEEHHEIPLDGPLPAVQTSRQQLTLTFHVPPGHQGPFVVNLQLPTTGTIHNLAAPSSSAVEILAESTALSSTSPIAVTSASSKGSRKLKRKPATFLDLPAELRNDIYKRAMINPAEKEINFQLAKNFSHCAALLRTCKQVYEEARQFLYGEHEFFFSRCDEKRGDFWQPTSTWEDIGWKDIRRFFMTIGGKNIAELRKIKFEFKDAKGTQYRSPNGKFASDDHLVEVLKMLAQHGQLEKITLDINGRGTISDRHDRFLRHLGAIKVDEVKIERECLGPIHNHYSYYSHRAQPSNPSCFRLSPELTKKLKEKMTRSFKKYV